MHKHAVYHFNHILSAQVSSFKYTLIVVQTPPPPISSLTFFSFPRENSVPVKVQLPAPSPAPGPHHSTFCLWV